MKRQRSGLLARTVRVFPSENVLSLKYPGPVRDGDSGFAGGGAVRSLDLLRALRRSYTAESFKAWRARVLAGGVR